MSVSESGPLCLATEYPCTRQHPIQSRQDGRPTDATGVATGPCLGPTALGGLWQGSGKSHTTSLVAESCLLHEAEPRIVRLQASADCLLLLLLLLLRCRQGSFKNTVVCASHCLLTRLAPAGWMACGGVAIRSPWLPWSSTTTPVRHPLLLLLAAPLRPRWGHLQT